MRNLLSNFRILYVAAVPMAFLGMYVAVKTALIDFPASFVFAVCIAPLVATLFLEVFIPWDQAQDQKYWSKRQSPRNTRP